MIVHPGWINWMRFTGDSDDKSVNLPVSDNILN